MLNDINKPFTLTSEEKDLDEIFHGEKKPLHPDTIYETFGKPAAEPTTAKANDTASTTKAAQNPARKPVEDNTKDATWQPPNHAPSFLDRLKAGVKYAFGFGGLNLLIFYWQQSGLMDASIAVPSMCVCAALAGWGVGINFAKGNRK